jgi:hypothetical protein
MSNPNFQQYDQLDLLYRISIPTNWSVPAHLDAGQAITYYTSPDKRQAIYTVAYQPGNGFQEFVQGELNAISSKGGQLLRSDQYQWQGQYPARSLLFQNYVTLFIEANRLVYNLAAAGEGVHLNDPTIHNIFSSFQIFPSPQARSLTDLQALQRRALEWQLAFEANRIMYETALHGIMTINPGMYRLERR